MSPKHKYLLTSLWKNIRRVGRHCPSCGCHSSTKVASKYLVTQLRRCDNCLLQFRVPTTSEEENATFYQSDYEQGFTTDQPTPEDLKSLLDSSFKGTEKDYQCYIEILSALACRPGDSLFDFGCSWGYGSWQLSQAGYRVRAFELSKPRCSYAKIQLGVDAHDSLDTVRGRYDIFFSSHVLEHVPSVAKCYQLARELVNSGGLFVALTPNGSTEYRNRAPQSWNKLWGLVHPNFLDDEFYGRLFGSSPFLLASCPYPPSKIQSWARNSRFLLPLEGVELLAVAVM